MRIKKQKALFIKLVLCIALFSVHVPALAKPARAVSGTLSIIPGLGQAANGDVLEGAAWFSTTLGLFFVSGNQVARDIGKMVWYYNMYDAFRDADMMNRNRYNVVQNYVAFLNPVNLIDPFSIGIVGYGAYQASSRGSSRNPTGPRSPVTGAFFFGFVGLGEEGLFRGFLFPAFSGAFKSKFAGAATSSVLFASAHLWNKSPWYRSVGGLTTLFLAGMVLCWQTDYNAYDLRHSIFAHAWYDILVDYGFHAQAEVAPKIPATGIRMNIPF